MYIKVLALPLMTNYTHVHNEKRVLKKMNEDPPKNVQILIVERCSSETIIEFISQLVSFVTKSLVLYCKRVGIMPLRLLLRCTFWQQVNDKISFGLFFKDL